MYTIRRYLYKNKLINTVCTTYVLELYTNEQCKTFTDTCSVSAKLYYIYLTANNTNLTANTRTCIFYITCFY